MTSGAKRVNSSIQLCTTLRGHTMKKGASTRTRGCAINAGLKLMVRFLFLSGGDGLRFLEEIFSEGEMT
jgi:hypothetical protein